MIPRSYAEHHDQMVGQAHTPLARLLVVDDDEGTRHIAAYVLRHAGYDVVLAANGQAALARAEHEGPFDLLVTDLRMPVMTGDELARHLRQRQPDLQVLYMSAFSDYLFLAHPQLWEGEAFLDKPMTETGLLEAVSLLLFGPVTPLGNSHRQ